VATKRPNGKTAKRSGHPGGQRKPVHHVRKATARDWISAARLATLPLSITPVVLGTAVAYSLSHEPDDAWWHWIRAAACLVVALALQIGVNFANDYSDGIRGTDAVRSGPRRLTASGAASPRSVLTVAIIFFAIAALVGLLVTWRSGHWWFLAVGAVCIAAAWFYTGGKRPYGYFAFGELAVFIFFGLVATLGTEYALAGGVSSIGWIAAVASGAFGSAAILIANTRDIATDRVSGKRTLSVLIGDRWSRILYVVLLAVPYAALAFYGLFLYDNAIYAYFSLLIAVPAAIIAILAKTPKELVLVLKLTALSSLAYALLAGWAIAF